MENIIQGVQELLMIAPFTILAPALLAPQRYAIYYFLASLASIFLNCMIKYVYTHEFYFLGVLQKYGVWHQSFTMIDSCGDDTPDNDSSDDDTQQSSSNLRFPTLSKFTGICIYNGINVVVPWFLWNNFSMLTNSNGLFVLGGLVHGAIGVTLHDYWWLGTFLNKLLIFSLHNVTTAGLFVAQLYSFSSVSDDHYYALILSVCMYGWLVIQHWVDIVVKEEQQIQLLKEKYEALKNE